MNKRLPIDDYHMNKIIFIDDYQFTIVPQKSIISMYIYKGSDYLGYLQFNNQSDQGFELVIEIEAENQHHIIKFGKEICIKLLIKYKFIFVKNNKKYLTDHFLLQLI